MNIPTTEELANLRVVVGNNTVTTHPVLGTIPVKGCFPLPVTKTGTVSTDTAGTTVGLVVKGVGTLFLSENVEQGDFLANADGIIRRITHVDDNLTLRIQAKFPADLSAAAVKLVKKNSFRYILASSTGSAVPKLNEQNFAVNDKWFSDGAPVSYDVSTVSSEISFTLSY